MSSRILSLLAGVSLLALAGAASADEPVTLSDAQMDGVSAGGGVQFGSVVVSDLDIDKAIDVLIVRNVNGTITISGNLASAEASASAFGNNTFVATEAFAQTTEWSSEAFSSAVAATD